MNKEKFERQVNIQAKLQDIDKKSVAEALKSYFLLIDKDIYQNVNINEAIMLAKRLQLFKPESKDESYPLSITSGNMLDSEILIEKITPYIEDVRKQIFGTKLPFDTIKKAVQWIEQKAKEPLPPVTEKKIQRFEKAFSKVVDLFLKNPFPCTISSPQYPILKYPGEKAVQKVPAINPDLLRIKEAVDKLVPATSFMPHAITAFLLTGIAPIIPRVIMREKRINQKIPLNSECQRFSLSLEINARDLTFKELKTIYDRIQERLHIKKKKRLNQKHEKLYQIVKRCGGPPEKDKVAFWKKIAKDCGYGGWRQAKIAYKRLNAKLMSGF